MKSKGNTPRVTGSNKSFVSISAENNEKHASANQIVEETRICDYVASYFEDVNAKVLARASQPFRIALEIDESADANNEVALSKDSWKFLSRHADHPAIGFVESAMEKLKIANRMLRSFKLRLAVEEVAT